MISRGECESIMRIESLYYRPRQFCFSVFMALMPQRKAKVITGNGSIYKIPKLVKDAGYKKIMIMTTPGFIRRGSLETLFQKFHEEGIWVSIYSHVMPDPTTDCVEDAETAYMQTGCEAIVAIGGGSVLDCAKALGARVAHPEKNLLQMNGLMKVQKHIPDIFAVPTTAGTGSEATAAAVITNGRSHYKYTIMDTCLVPRYAILDPELLLDLPAEITAATGMDALTHAVEAYTNRFASPKTRKNAIQAVMQIYENLIAACENGQDVKVRKNMLMASYNAGVAINNNFVGYVHALSHGIGGLYGVPHGKANAVILPYVLEYYGKHAEKKLADLAEAVGLEGGNRTEKAKAFIESIRDLNRKIGIPETLDELNEKDFPELTRRALKEANPLYPVPMIWGWKDVNKVLKRVKEG